MGHFPIASHHMFPVSYYHASMVLSLKKNIPGVAAERDSVHPGLVASQITLHIWKNIDNQIHIHTKRQFRLARRQV